MNRPHTGANDMAKANKTAASGQTNGALVFEEMPADFEIPNRVRSGAYDDILEQLQKTDKVVVIFRTGKGVEAKAANTRRKSLVKSAESKGLEIRASVRHIDGDNLLLAQYIGKLKKADKAA